MGEGGIEVLIVCMKCDIHSCFNVLLTVHLRIFILVINQLDAQNLFYNNFISYIIYVIYSLWYHHTYRCDDTRGCIIQF